MTQNTKKKAV